MPDETPLKQLGPGQDSFCLFESANTYWSVRVPVGVEPRDLQNPGYWAHHATKMRPGDEIRALAEDGAWRAKFLVVDQDRTWVKVLPISFNKLEREPADTSEIDAFVALHKVMHRGPRKWSVVRIADNAVIQEDLAEKETAINWLNAHARSQLGAEAA